MIDGVLVTIRRRLYFEGDKRKIEKTKLGGEGGTVDFHQPCLINIS